MKFLWIQDLFRKELTSSLPSFSLAWFRLVYGFALISQLIWDRLEFLALTTSTTVYNGIPLFDDFGFPKPDPAVFQLAFDTLLFCLFMATGAWWKPRLFFALSTLLSLFVIGSYLGYVVPVGTDYVYHSQNITIFTLAVLTLIPSSWHLPIQNLMRPELRSQVVPRWPFFLIQWSLAMVYFGAAFQKIKSSGLQWMDGETLQAIFLEHALILDHSITLAISNQFWLCWILSVLITIFEITFPVACFHRALGRVYAFAALLFHASIWALMEINFLKYHALTLLIFFFDSDFLSGLSRTTKKVVSAVFRTRVPVG